MLKRSSRLERETKWTATMIFLGQLRVAEIWSWPALCRAMGMPRSLKIVHRTQRVVQLFQLRPGCCPGTGTSSLMYCDCH